MHLQVQLHQSYVERRNFFSPASTVVRAFIPTAAISKQQNTPLKVPSLRNPSTLKLTNYHRLLSIP